MAKRMSKASATVEKTAVTLEQVQFLLEKKGFSAQSILDSANNPAATIELTEQAKRYLTDIVSPPIPVDPLLAALSVAPVMKPVGNATPLPITPPETRLERLERENAELRRRVESTEKSHTEKSMKFVVREPNNLGAAGRQGQWYKASIELEDSGNKFCFISRELFKFLHNTFTNPESLQELANMLTECENLNRKHVALYPDTVWFRERK